MMNPFENLTYKLVMLEGKSMPLLTILLGYDEPCSWASAVTKNWCKIINNFGEKAAKIQPFISGFSGRGLIRFDWIWEVEVFCALVPKLWVSAPKDQKNPFYNRISKYVSTSETHINCPVCANLSQQIVWGLCQYWAEWQLGTTGSMTAATYGCQIK